MSTTYTDAYTIVDVINTQATTDAVNESNEGSGTYRPSSYDSTTNPTGGKILDTGYSQKSLYEMLMEIQVNWDEAMVLLDGDCGTTTYSADCSIAEATEAAGLDGNYSADVIAALLTLGIPNVGKINLYPQGCGTVEVAIFCQAVASMIAKCTALLDADGWLADIDYAITTVAARGTRGKTDIKFSEITSATPANFASFDITYPHSKIKTTGIDQAALVDFLNTVVTNINALWAKIDADFTAL